MAKAKDALLDPIFVNNPIAVQILGICSALAVTISIYSGISSTLLVSAACYLLLLPCLPAMARRSPK